MKQLIDNIRNKPHHEKSRIVWIVAGSVAAVLIIVWILVGMPSRNGNSGDVINQFSESLEENKDVIPNPFEESK